METLCGYIFSVCVCVCVCVCVWNKCAIEILWLVLNGPHGLTFTWWGCRGLCFWHKPTEFAHSFYSVLVSISVFIALSTAFHSINSPDNSPLSHSVLPVLFLPYWQPWCNPLWLTGLKAPTNYALLALSTIYESLRQPWYNPLWLTGLKAPTN